MYHLKIKGDFQYKCLYYIINYAINWTPSQFHWSLIGHISHIPCAKFKVYTCNIHDLVTIQPAEMLLNYWLLYFWKLWQKTVTEKWLQDNNCDVCDLNGYELIGNHRQTRHGVGAYFRNYIPYQIRPDIVISDNILGSFLLKYIYWHTTTKI